MFVKSLFSSVRTPSSKWLIEKKRNLLFHVLESSLEQLRKSGKDRNRLRDLTWGLDTHLTLLSVHLGSSTGLCTAASVSLASPRSESQLRTLHGKKQPLSSCTWNSNPQGWILIGLSGHVICPQPPPILFPGVRGINLDKTHLRGALGERKGGSQGVSFEKEESHACWRNRS